MEGMDRRGEAGSHARGRKGKPLAEDLERIARRPVALGEAFQTLARYQEEQARTVIDLLERETWVLGEILARSGPIWDQLTSPTLRFTVERADDPQPYHLELGRFAHLAALVAPTAEEQDLAAATEPRWARVATHPDRQFVGRADALTCSYTPISNAEAISLIGLQKILDGIIEATCAAGKALLAVAQAQAERQECLLAVERMLQGGSDAEQAPAAPTPARRRLALALFGAGGSSRLLLSTFYVGLVAFLFCLLISAY